MFEPKRDSQSLSDKRTGIFLTIIFALARLAGISHPPRRDFESKTSEAMDAALKNGVDFNETIDSFEAGLQSGISNQGKKS